MTRFASVEFEPTPLSQLTEHGGCAAKASPALVSLLSGLTCGIAPADPDVLVGLSPSDDAAVYRIDDQRSLVATVDYFPPIVNDPSDYGAIAAANAVSDIYAMGGELAFALTISGFPASVDDADIAATNAAAATVVAECGGHVLGGHSIRSAEPIFGLCAIGFVETGSHWCKGGARPGDVLMLSKPIGTGLLVCEGSERSLAAAAAWMRKTNRCAAGALRAMRRPPSAATDVTGYGLLGHAAEVASRSDTVLCIEAENVPVISGARSAAAAGLRTSAHGSILASVTELIDPRSKWSDLDQALLCDPQTSGGLLASVHSTGEAALTERGFVRIGYVEEGPAGLRIE